MNVIQFQSFCDGMFFLAIFFLENCLLKNPCISSSPTVSRNGLVNLLGVNFTYTPSHCTLFFRLSKTPCNTLNLSCRFGFTVFASSLSIRVFSTFRNVPTSDFNLFSSRSSLVQMIYRFDSIHLPALKTLQMIRGFEFPSRRSVYFGSIGFYPSVRFASILDLECSKYHPSLTFHLISADRIFLRFVGFVPASPIR